MWFQCHWHMSFSTTHHLYCHYKEQQEEHRMLLGRHLMSWWMCQCLHRRVGVKLFCPIAFWWHFHQKQLCQFHKRNMFMTWIVLSVLCLELDYFGFIFSKLRRHQLVSLLLCRAPCEPNKKVLQKYVAKWTALETSVVATKMWCQSTHEKRKLTRFQTLLQKSVGECQQFFAALQSSAIRAVTQDSSGGARASSRVFWTAWLLAFVTGGWEFGKRPPELLLRFRVAHLLSLVPALIDESSSTTSAHIDFKRQVSLLLDRRSILAVGTSSNYSCRTTRSKRETAKRKMAASAT